MVLLDGGILGLVGLDELKLGLVGLGLVGLSWV